MSEFQLVITRRNSLKINEKRDNLEFKQTYIPLHQIQSTAFSSRARHYVFP